MPPSTNLDSRAAVASSGTAQAGRLPHCRRHMLTTKDCHGRLVHLGSPDKPAGHRSTAHVGHFPISPSAPTCRVFTELLDSQLRQDPPHTQVEHCAHQQAARQLVSVRIRGKTRCLSTPSRMAERATCSLLEVRLHPRRVGFLRAAKPTRASLSHWTSAPLISVPQWSIQGPDAIRCKRQTILEIALCREDIPSDAPSLRASLPGPR